MYDIFISYKSQDELFAKEIEKRLSEGEKYSVFRDNSSMRKGDRWEEEIESAVKNCKHFVMLMTQKYFDACTDKSGWVYKEIKLATEAAKSGCTLVPVIWSGAWVSADAPKDITELINNACATQGYKKFAIDKLDELVSFINDSLFLSYKLRQQVKDYFFNLENECKKIVILGGDNESEKNISDLNKIYVKQTLKKVLSKEEREKGGKPQIDFEINDLLKDDSPNVIIGNAGVGKSLITKKLIVDVLADNSTQRLTSGCRIPFFVSLQKYENFLKEARRKSSREKLVDFICKESHIEAKVFDTLQKNCSLLFVVDGMDEVLRNLDDIIKNFESLADAKDKVIFSSRPSNIKIRGENTFAFKDKEIIKYEAGNFNKVQQSQYINNYWDNIINNPTQKEGFIKSLNAEEERSENYRELSQNPFLLSKIIEIFRQSEKGELPNSKIEIYGQCVKLIIETRDASLMPSKLKESNKIIEILEALAFYLYKAESKRKNTKEKTIEYSTYKVKDIVVDAVKPLYNPKTDREAEAITNEFLEYIKCRALFADDNFAHQTFKEYFAACYIYHNFCRKDCNWNINKKAIFELISDNKDQTYWSAVVEMLLCCIDKEAGENPEPIEKTFDLFLGDFKKATPDYDLLCGAAKQFANHKELANTKLLETMLLRGSTGVVNPFCELYYYLPVYELLPYLNKAFVCLKNIKKDERDISAMLCKRAFKYFAYQKSLRMSSEMFDIWYKQKYRLRDVLCVAKYYRKYKYDKVLHKKVREDADLFMREGWSKSEYILYRMGVDNIATQKGVIIVEYGTTILGNSLNGEKIISNDIVPRYQYGFIGCENLIGIDMPESVNEIGEWRYDISEKHSMTYPVFSGCTKLEMINVNTFNEKFVSEGGMLFSKDGSELKLIRCPVNRKDEYSIPFYISNTRWNAIEKCFGIKMLVTKIGRYAFNNCKIKEVKLPNSILEIEDGAFAGCAKLTQINIPREVNAIGTSVFFGCENLTIHVHDKTKEEAEQLWGKRWHCGCKVVYEDKLRSMYERFKELQQ